MCSSGALPYAAFHTGRPRDVRADRHHAARQALRERHHVGHDAFAVAREQRAAAAEARLHLVGDHHRAGFVADRAHVAQVPVGRHVDAAFALDRLDDHRRDRRRRRAPRSAAASPNGTRRTSASSGTNGSRNASRPLAESAPSVLPWNARVGRDDRRTPRRGARELERALDRLGAAVGEERDREVARRELGQPLRQPAHQRVEHRAARQRHAVELVLDRRDDARMAVTEREDAVAAGEVEVRLAGVVGDRAAATPTSRPASRKASSPAPAAG